MSKSVHVIVAILNFSFLLAQYASLDIVSHQPLADKKSVLETTSQENIIIGDSITFLLMFDFP